MNAPRLRTPLTAALGCALLALSAVAAARTNEPAEAIKSDARHLAVDVHREARVVGHRARSDAHELHRQLQVARERTAVQLHQLRHRIQRWWNHVRTS